jgi:hypothetical protein
VIWSCGLCPALAVLSKLANSFRFDIEKVMFEKAICWNIWTAFFSINIYIALGT